MLSGPLFVGEPYEIDREVVALSGSRRTESMWIRTRVFQPAATRCSRRCCSTPRT